MTIEHISRLLAVARMVQRPGSRTAAQMVDEMEVSLRTLMRDLNTLREEWGLPIEYDRKTNTYTADREGCRRAILEIFGLEEFDD
jgi:predicted DNA-binding transcriptional regulator YafY